MRIFMIFLLSISLIFSKLCFWLASIWGSNPRAWSFPMALNKCGLGLLSAIFCIPAFSKKGLYLAITANVSTLGVPAKGRVSLTLFVPARAKTQPTHLSGLATAATANVNPCFQLLCFQVFEAYLLFPLSA